MARLLCRMRPSRSTRHTAEFMASNASRQPNGSSVFFRTVVMSFYVLGRPSIGGPEAGASPEIGLWSNCPGRFPVIKTSTRMESSGK